MPPVPLQSRTSHLHNTKVLAGGITTDVNLRTSPTSAHTRRCCHRGYGHRLSVQARIRLAKPRLPYNTGIRMVHHLLSTGTVCSCSCHQPSSLSTQLPRVKPGKTFFLLHPTLRQSICLVQWESSYRNGSGFCLPLRPGAPFHPPSSNGSSTSVSKHDPARLIAKPKPNDPTLYLEAGHAISEWRNYVQQVRLLRIATSVKCLIGS